MTRSDQQMKLTPKEWAISVVLHLIVLGLLIWFTPARQVLESLADKNNPPPPPEQAHQDPTEVKEVVQAISQEQADAAKEHVKQLSDLEKKLDQMAKDRLDEFNKQAKDIAANAAQKALDQLKQIPPGQDATAQAQSQLDQQLQPIASGTNAPTNADTLKQMRDQLAATEQTVQQSQIKTQEDQEKVTQLLHFTGQDSAASQAQQKADDAQNTAALSEQAAVKVQQDLLNNLGTQTWQTANVNREKDHVAQQQAQLDAANAAAAQQQPAVDAAKAQLDAATAAYNQARDFAMTDKKPEDWKAQDQAHKVVEQAQRDYNKAASLQNEQLNRAKTLQAMIQNPVGLQKTTEQLAATQAQYAQLQDQLKTAQDTAQKDQAAAKQAQLDSITQLTAIANGPAQPPPPPANPPELATDKEVDPATLENKNLAQLYQTAQQIQDRVTDKYKVYRAAEFGSIQKLTLPDAMKATEVAKPNMEKLDTELLAAKGATKNFDKYKTEVTKAKQQIQAMVDLSSDMVGMAEAQQNVGNGDVSLQEDKYNQMVAGAMDDPNAAGKDLTNMTGKDDGKHGSGSGDESADPSSKSGGAGEKMEDAEMDSKGAQEYNRNAPELPTMEYNTLKPYPTRTITANGPHHNDWLYVDSWYLIGPFPNEGRANLNTKFPPESVIDLDAVYPGKGGRVLHWVYTQWDHPNLSPAHDREDAPAIYYAYTEIYCDQPYDLWIASGSDDKGTMWLNDVMVWNSNDILKYWHPNEGYRKVHFKQGFNKILYRLENGQYTAVFSLMISSKQG
jgi:hypothetical protein